MVLAKSMRNRLLFAIIGPIRESSLPRWTQYSVPPPPLEGFLELFISAMLRLTLSLVRELY